LRSISTCVSTYGFDLLFRLAHTACICHRLCGRESVGFAADRSFSPAFEHCIHAVSPRHSIYDAFRSQLGQLRWSPFLRIFNLLFRSHLSLRSLRTLTPSDFGDRLRLHFSSALRFQVYQIRLRAGLRYGCLSLSITSVSLRAYSMLTARIGHSVFDCGSLISSLTLRLQFRYFLRMPAVRLRTLSYPPDFVSGPSVLLRSVRPAHDCFIDSIFAALNRSRSFRLHRRL
jgi:hypothetical protein